MKNNLYGSLMTDSLVKFQKSLESISNMYLNVFNLNDMHASITSLQAFDTLNNAINSMIGTANLHYVQESLRWSLGNISETLQNSFFSMENLSTLIGNSLGNLKIDAEKALI